MSHTQKDTQKHTHGHALAHINGGLHALRRAIAARVPDDFDVTFIDSVEAVSLAYVWTGDGRFEYQEEITAPTVAALLVKWQAVNWDNERRAAFASSHSVQALLGAN